MALPSSGPISLNDIKAEMGLTGSYSLQQLVDASSLADKSPPYSLFDFYGYEHRFQVITDACGGQDGASGSGSAAGIITLTGGIAPSGGLTVTLRIYNTGGTSQDHSYTIATFGSSVAWSASLPYDFLGDTYYDFTGLDVLSVSPTSAGKNDYVPGSYLGGC